MSRDGLIQLRGLAAVIESLPETQNARGEAVPGAPVSFASGMALIQPLSGRELVAAQELFAAVTHRIAWTPFVAGVLAKMRVNVGGVLYDIGVPLVLRPDPWSSELELLAVQRGV